MVPGNLSENIYQIQLYFGNRILKRTFGGPNADSVQNAVCVIITNFYISFTFFYCELFNLGKGAGSFG